MQFSLLDRRPEESSLPLLLDNNIGVLARGTVASGLLVNKPAKPYINYTEKQVKDAATSIQFLSGEQRSTAQTSLQFVLQNPAITSAIVGIRTLDQLQEALDFSTTPRLTVGELEALRQSIKINYYDQHR